MLRILGPTTLLIQFTGLRSLQVDQPELEIVPSVAAVAGSRSAELSSPTRAKNLGGVRRRLALSIEVLGDGADDGRANDHALGNLGDGANLLLVFTPKPTAIGQSSLPPLCAPRGRRHRQGLALRACNCDPRNRRSQRSR